jgi:hypothetical protein
MTNIIDLQEQRQARVKADIELMRSCKSFEEVLEALPRMCAEFRTELGWQMLASIDDKRSSSAVDGANLGTLTKMRMAVMAAAEISEAA